MEHKLYRLKEGGMMEAKVTVRNFDNTILATVNSLLEAQAKITWDIAFEAGLRQGMKIVAQYIKANWSCRYPVGSSGYAEYQSKLKEWGNMKRLDK